MTATSIARATTRAQSRDSRPRARIPATAKLGVAVVVLAASLVFAAAAVVLLSALYSFPVAAPVEGDSIGPDVIGALLLGGIAIAAVVEAIRLARDVSRPRASAAPAPAGHLSRA